MLEDWTFLNVQTEDEAATLRKKVRDLEKTTEVFIDELILSEYENGVLERRIAIAGWFFMGLGIVSALFVFYALAHGNLWMAILASVATAAHAFGTLKVEQW